VVDGVRLWSRIFFSVTIIAALTLAWPSAILRPSSAAPATGLPGLSAGGAVLLDPVTGGILYARRPFDPMPPASTTKIMTCLLVLERCGLDEVVAVSQRAATTGGSRIGLRAGGLIPVQDLLVGLMLRSGNDAATALAEHVAGSVEGFAALMTARAHALGALSTNFVNPHGLSARGHVSTAYDLALMAVAAMQNPVFRTLVASREHEIGSLDPYWTRLLKSTNKLLWLYPGADGVKTGTTSEAGQCLVASATRDGRQLISVVLHSSDRYSDSARLLSAGFETTRLCLLGLAGEPVRSVEAVDRMTPWGQPWWRPWIPAIGVPLVLCLRETLAFNYPAGPCPQLEIRFTTDGDSLELPLAAGETVGSVVVWAHGRVVAAAGLTVGEPVPRGYPAALFLKWLVRVISACLVQGLR
jgi:D-alanyl-D-alanine carboxypeptidase (penicillin-binding protein 5/6)